MIVRSDMPPVKQARWRFQPDYIANSVSDIDFEYLKKSGLKACFIDLDGTVVSKATFDVAPAVTRKLQSSGLSIYIATNRPKSRELKNLKTDLAATGIIHPDGLHPKPRKAYYLKALAQYKYQPHEVIMIGDRYIQDIWGANHAGLVTLVVHKTGGSFGWFDRSLSKLERLKTLRLSGSYRQV